MAKYQLKQTAENIQRDLDLIESLGLEFSSSTMYYGGDIVRKDNKFYQCNSLTTYGPTEVFNTDYWDIVSLNEVKEWLINRVSGAITDHNYDASQSYSAGDIVCFKGHLYAAKDSIAAPAGAFDYNKWTKTSVEELIQAKQNVLVSGTNIKTVHGNSILGSGNIDVVGPAGNGISSINVQESQVSGGNNVVTVNYTNGDSSSFNVKNGAKGDVGPAISLRAGSNFGQVGTPTLEKESDTSYVMRYCKGERGADGLTTSVEVNGQTYTQSGGKIILPNYPSPYDDTTLRGLISSETSRATGQENKNLYHLGAYDSVSGNVITRQTGYLNVIDLLDGFYQYSWNHKIFELTIPLSAITDIGQQSQWINFTLNDTTNYIKGNVYYAGVSDYTVSVNKDKLAIINANDDINVLKEYLSQHQLIIQYKLATSYTEEIIENQPLTTLDQAGSQWLRSEWEKGLNLFDINGDWINNNVSYSISNNSVTITNRGSNQWDNLKKAIPVKPNIVYTISLNQSYATYVYIYDGTNVIVIRGDGQQVEQNLNYTFTTPSNCYELWVQLYDTRHTGNTISNIMLVEGSHAYPYQEYKGKLVRTPYVDKVMYNLGTYDTINGNTITRQTGYVKGGNYTSTGTTQSGRLTYEYRNNITNRIYTDIVNNLGYEQRNTDNWWQTGANLEDTKGYVSFANDDSSVVIIPPINTIPSDDLQIQYKLATSYTETIIEDRPLNTLDQDGCNWVRNEWEKGLNLIPNFTWLNHYKIDDATGQMSGGAWYQEFNALNEYLTLKPNTTYSLSANGGKGSRLYIYYYDSNKGFLSSAYVDMANQNYYVFTTINTFAFVRFTTYGSGNQSALSQVMLNEGTNAYPYVPYNANKHITNEQAELLKQEWEKGLNLWSGANTLIANTTYSQSLPAGTYTYSFTLNANAPQGVVIKIGSTTIVSEAISVGYHAYTFTTSGDTLTHIQYGGTSTQVMLNEGSHAYPYAPYNANKHISNEQAELLKQEWEKGLNLGSFPDRSGRWWVSEQSDLTYFINQLPNGTYTISADCSPLSIDSGYNIADCFFWLQITGGQYTGDGVHNEISGFTALNQIKRVSLTFTKEDYTNYSFRLWGFGNHNGGNHGAGKCSNIMIIEADHPYPYQEYKGSIVRQVELKNYLPLSGGTISSSNIVPLIINSTNNDNGSTLLFSRDSVYYSQVGYYHGMAYVGADYPTYAKIGIVTSLNGNAGTVPIGKPFYSPNNGQTMYQLATTDQFANQLIKVKEFDASTSSMTDFQSWMRANSNTVISVIYYNYSAGDTSPKSVIFDAGSNIYKCVASNGTLYNISLSSDEDQGDDRIRVYYLG